MPSSSVRRVPNASMLVVDASALVELLLDRPAARQIAGLITARGSDLHAPHLLDIEVLERLRALLYATRSRSSGPTKRWTTS